MKNKIAFLALRISLGTVFLLFGIGKLRHDIWAETMASMPFFKALPWGVGFSVQFVGISEILIGAALIIGLCTRVFAAFAVLELLGILSLLKFGEIRDIGLLGSALYLALTRDECIVRRIKQEIK